MKNTFDRTVYSLCLEIDELKEEVKYWREKYEEEKNANFKMIDDKMIKKFTLGAIKWNINVDNNRLNDLKLLGLCEFPKSLISIHDEVDNVLIEQTIYHEVVHAILETMGENELSANDKFVQNFSLLLHQFETTKK